MRTKILLTAAITLIGLLITTTVKPKKDYEKEIREAEKAFEKMAAEKGIAQAFYFYADDNAVIKREKDTLIKGKDGIRNYHGTQNLKNTTVNWTPDFVSVSEDGTMAYTYGKYVWKVKEANGKIKEHKGVFHTVWKRQKDGSWKYVWD